MQVVRWVDHTCVIVEKVSYQATNSLKEVSSCKKGLPDDDVNNIEVEQNNFIFKN